MTGHSGALVFETNGSDELRLVKRYRPDAARIWNETGDFDLLSARCRPSASTN